MGAPIIFAGANAKLLNSGNIVNAAGASLTPQKNYFANTNNASGWTASAGGIAVSTETTVANIPDGVTQLTGLKILRASGSDYAYYRFTLDQADYNKLLQIAWDQAYAGTAGDYTVTVYSNTASNYGGTSTQLTTPVSSIAALIGSFNTTFTTPGSAAPYIEVRINGIAGTTGLWLNNFYVGPGTLVQGAAVSEWVSYTPTITGFGSATSIVGQYRRVGSQMEIMASWVAGTVSGSLVSASLPTGFNLNSSVLTINNTTSNTGNVVGHYTNPTTTAAGYVVTAPATDSTLLYFGAKNTGTASGTPQVGTAIFSNSVNIAIIATVPISQFSGSGTVNLGQGAQVEFAFNTSVSNAADTTSFGYGPQGTPFPSSALTAIRLKTVRFQYPIQPTDQITMEVQLNNGAWIEFTDAGTVAGNVNALQALATQNNVWYGSGIVDQVNSTDVRIAFGQYNYASGATYGAAGAAWDAFSGAVKWRLKKCTSSAPVGFGTATNTVNGLTVNPRQYLVGTAYTNGTPAFTGQAGFVAGRGCLIPYQTYDGRWRLRLNFTYTQTSGTNADVTLSGIVFNDYEAMSACAAAANSGPIQAFFCRTDTGTNGKVVNRCVTSGETSFCISGDVELTGKPTWAD